jgi:hypothetical protein
MQGLRGKDLEDARRRTTPFSREKNSSYFPSRTLDSFYANLRSGVASGQWI